MASSLIPILASAATLAGSVTAALQAAASTRQARAATAEVRRLAQGEELEVLQSNDIDRLGRYLYENIGSTRISNYVQNSEVRAQVSRALDSVLHFLELKKLR